MMLPQSTEKSEETGREKSLGVLYRGPNRLRV